MAAERGPVELKRPRLKTNTAGDRRVEGPNPCAWRPHARFERKDEICTSERLRAVVGRFQQMHTDENPQRPQRYEVNDMSIRQLIVSAFALAFLVSVFACAPPGVNELEDPPRAQALARALASEYKSDPVRFVRDRVGTQFRARGKVLRVGADGTVRFSHGMWYVGKGEYLECRFRDPNTPALVNRYDKITVRGTVESVASLGRHDDVLHMVDCEMDAGG